MHSVKILTSDLLKALTDNRAKHRADYTSAMEVYRDEVITAVDNMWTAAHKREDVRPLHLVKPTNYLREYDRAIKMATMSVDKEVELDQNDFAQYVMDEWAWKSSFTAMTSTYAKHS